MMNMKAAVQTNYKIMAEIAKGRSEMYQVLLSAFCNLVDMNLVENIRTGKILELVQLLNEIDNKNTKKGIKLLEAYLNGLDAKNEDQIFNELAVDRTKIMRATDLKDQKPPYESLYKRQGNLIEYAGKLNLFYKKAGLELNDATHESSDYLCVELDFMRQLCLEELKCWCNERSGFGKLSIQKEFLNKHLGSWINLFCAEALTVAATEFYKGFLEILNGFIFLDAELISNIP